MAFSLQRVHYAYENDRVLGGPPLRGKYQLRSIIAAPYSTHSHFALPRDGDYGYRVHRRIDNAIKSLQAIATLLRLVAYVVEHLSAPFGVRHS
jgi:hypothetical protein